MTMTSMRQWLAVLAEEKLLRVVSRQVSLQHELAAVGKKADGRWAVRFDHPEDFDIPVVTGIAGSRALIAKAMRVAVPSISEHFFWAQTHPSACKIVDRASAPVKEVITAAVDLGRLPIPVHHEKDGGRYLTAGLLVSKDPSTGARNVSIHRLQVLGPDRLGILILPRHLAHFYRAAEQTGKALEVAIAIGVDPVLLLSSQALAPLGFDEFTIASTLYGEALKLVKCETVDLEVPAEAEIVLEGRILPGVRETEGPFGEYPKYYGPPSLKPVVALTAMTTRKNPIYHTIVPATLEHLLIGSIPREVVVDEDVDIFDPVEVEWAIATRFQAGRDSTIITRALGNKLDPSSDNGVSDKLGIDATVPLGADPFRYERIRIPGEKDIDLESYFD